jgi:outer membrane lipoprotein carrier protein
MTRQRDASNRQEHPMNFLIILTRAWLGLAAPAAAAPASPPAAGAAQPSAEAVVANVQSFYTKIKQVTATFRQEVTNQQFGTTKSSNGTVWLMKPGKMRWDYLAQKGSTVQVKKSFISNGKQLYIVEHDNKRVEKKSLQQDLMPVAVSFLTGTGDLNKEFKPELDATTSYGSKGDYVLKLTPREPSAQYKALYLIADPKDFHVKESVIVDSSSNVNHFLFFAPDFEKPIPDTWFEFNPATVKNTYSIIDLDQQQHAQGSNGATPAPPPASKN